mgnify:CR=1 FL=1
MRDASSEETVARKPYRAWVAASRVGLDELLRHSRDIVPLPRDIVEELVPLGSEALLRYPFVWLTGHLPVRFTQQERENVRRYLDRGGLLFVDDHNHDVDGAFHRTASEEVTRAVGPLRELPNDHALYRAFFTFEDGPPTTSHELNGWGDNLVHEHLFAAYHGDRVAVLYSNKDYSSEWGYHPDSKRFMAVDNTRFAVNLVVYALTR